MHPRRYETLFLLHPDLSEEEVTAVQRKCTDIIDQMGGRLLFLDNWGYRRMAYEIKGQSRGFYYLMEYAGQPALMAEIERQMRIDERVFRFMSTLREREFSEERYEQEKVKREAEARKAREEAATAEARQMEGAAEAAGAEGEAAFPETPEDEEADKEDESLETAPEDEAEEDTRSEAD
jgi:small subunit ribosomal protein S6